MCYILSDILINTRGDTDIAIVLRTRSGQGLQTKWEC